jgi:hypothetical protein
VKVSRRRLSQHLAAISFLILYPVFFFYNAGIAFGYIRPVLGGLYGAYSLIVVSIYAIILTPFAEDIRFHTAWIMKLSYIFVGWISFWVSFNYLFNEDPYADTASMVLFGVLIQMLANFAIGVYLNLNAKWFIVSIFVLLLCMLVFVLSTFDRETLSVHGGLYWGEAKDLVDPESFATYQQFARSTLLTSFIVFAIFNNFMIRLLVAFISTVILFLLSARSEIVGFLFAVMVFEILISLGKPSRIFVLASLGFFMAIFLAFVDNSFVRDLSGSRIMALGDLDRDSSWQIRSEFSHRALMQIIDNPLFGKFAGEYYEGLGEEGTYAHNILSAWVSLGLPGFLLYLSLLLGSFLVAIRRVIVTKGNSDLWNLALLTSVTALLLSFSAKSFAEPWFGLVFGLVLNVSREESRSSQKRALRSPLSALRSAL